MHINKLKMTLTLLLFPYFVFFTERDSSAFDGWTEAQISETKLLSYIGFGLHFMILAPIAVLSFFFLLSKILPC